MTSRVMKTFNLRKIAGLRGRQRKLLRPVTASGAVEAAYRRILLQHWRSIRRYLREEYAPAVARLRPVGTRDAVPVDLAKLNGALKAFVNKQNSLTRAKLRKLWQLYMRTHTAAWIEAAKVSLGVDVAVLVQASDLAVAMAAAREASWVVISGATATATAAVEARALEYMAGGKSPAKLAKELRELLGVNERRAKLIARDQIAKANTTFNRIRQQQAGVDRYRWSTSSDERVRATHRANNGKVFRWDQPPATTGHPGNDIQCRCVAMGVV